MDGWESVVREGDIPWTHARATCEWNVLEQIFLHPSSHSRNYIHHSQNIASGTLLPEAHLTLLPRVLRNVVYLFVQCK